MLSAGARTDGVIGTPRLSLSPLAPEHAPALFRLLDDWDVARMLAEVPWPVTPAGVQAFAEAQRRNTETENFAVAAGDELIGCAGIKKPGSGHPPRTMPRLGYWIGRPFWRRGYGTEMVGALVARAFHAYPADLVGAGVFHDNAASCRILEKLGFEPAGRYETPCASRGGSVPTIDMRLTRARWEGAPS